MGDVVKMLGPGVALAQGDCRQVLARLPAASAHAVVCDPPYELGFMGKAWDSSGVAFQVETWAAVLRVLKPGGHLLAFGGTRTFHRMACAMEDAGFELRDTLSWLYGSGMPKNAQTQMKPAWEPVLMARAPLAGTMKANVLAHGTGALNVDACRLPASDGYLENRVTQGGDHFSIGSTGRTRGTTFNPNPFGRWPANVLLDEQAAALLDAQSGERGRTGALVSRNANGRASVALEGGHRMGPSVTFGHGDTGGASRFFYVAKASRAERGAGNNHPTVKPLALMRWLVRLVTPPGGLVLDPFAGSGTTLLAARLEGRRAFGVELEAAHVEIAERRLLTPLERKASHG